MQLCSGHPKVEDLLRVPQVVSSRSGMVSHSVSKQFFRYFMHMMNFLCTAFCLLMYVFISFAVEQTHLTFALTYKNIIVMDQKVIFHFAGEHLICPKYGIVHQCCHTACRLDVCVPVTGVSHLVTTSVLVKMFYTWSHISVSCTLNMCFYTNVYNSIIFAIVKPERTSIFFATSHSKGSSWKSCCCCC